MKRDARLARGRRSAMKIARLLGVLSVSISVLLAPAVVCVADDGRLIRRNISDTPELHTEHAAIGVMPMYVPGRNASGDPVEIEYFDAEDFLIETRDVAKPLVATYLDGEVTFVEGLNFTGHGSRDAHVALSLDDGGTWKKVNLSESGALSSFTFADGTDYPGDVFGVSAAVAGDKVLVAWVSRYCFGGSPAYLDPDEGDLFGVSGNQNSIDFAVEGYPEVGEVPYACLWTARGVLDGDGGGITWRKAERVTSGERDVNLVQVAGAGSAGFVAAWQEDPDGLRPGQALCADGGWNGAVAHQGTDIWYTWIGWHVFDGVEDAGAVRPQVSTPMAVPVRLTDNAMCNGVPSYDQNGNLVDPYCFYDFDNDIQYPEPNPSADLCVTTTSWPNPGGTTLELCSTEDGRVLTGRTAATRPRINLQPYLKSDGTTSAWVVLAHEEDKAMGEGSVPEGVEPLDIGKDIRYLTFEMSYPEMVAQGMMLNQPAVDRETGTFFPIIEDDWGNEYWETEIARDPGLMTQPSGKVGDSDLVAMVLYSQGIINQGGPADVMARRFVLPDGFDPVVDNPFAYENMVCEGWDYADGSNPNYVLGLCTEPAINLSGYSVVDCDIPGSAQLCIEAFPWDGTEESSFPKVLEWSQDMDNLDDQSWENPYDLAVSPRGYLDDDFVMALYSWTPNWKASTEGQSPSNLYARRSFDGGLTWTTTPADLGGDGTITCEFYGHKGKDKVEDCTTYGAGEFEQARNLSLLTSTKVTVIDPCFAQTAETVGDSSFDGDDRDPSAFFVAYGTGDTTTMADGFVEPLSIFYSRASNWGDDYELVEYTTTGAQQTVERWDWLAQGKLIRAGEANLKANPAGDRLYAVWSQEDYDRRGNLIGIDAWARRIYYILNGE